VYLADLVETYNAHVRDNGLLAASSREGYTSWCRAYCRWYEAQTGEPPTAEAFSVHFIKRYKGSVSARFANNTIRGVCHSLRHFGNWLVAEHILPSNPAMEVPQPKKKPGKRLLVSTVEVKAILAACDRIANQRRAALARAIVSLLIYAGPRRSELTGAKVVDIDLRKREITIPKGKGDKLRVVPICDECADNIRSWLRLRGKCRLDNLFMLDIARRVSDGSLRTILEEVKAIAGYPSAENIKPHSLRHWYATQLLIAGNSLADISELLGHSSIHITTIYLHATSAGKHRAAQSISLNPKVAPTREMQIRRRIPL
jgi:site-specific recombinase XerD